MANIVSMADLRSTLTANLQLQRAALPPPSGTKIRAKAKEGFTLPDGTILDTIEAVVADMRYVNTLYTKRYVPGQIESPDCWAIDADSSLMVPDDKSAKKQAADCATCPKNEWGSDPTGGRGKACKNGVRLAIVQPDADDKSPIYTLDLAPTSTGPFIKVLRGLTVPWQTVIFNFSLDATVDYPKIKADLLGPAPDTLAPYLQGLMAKAAPLVSRGFDFE